MELAFWCVLVMGVMPVVTVGIAKARGVDNHAPRDWAQTIDGYRKRAYAAHLNHYEAFPLFAAAVLVAATQGAPMATVNALALAVVAARLVYTACYVADLATLRSLVWLAGWGLTIAIFVLPAL
ncbi:MAPEG family protein [Blastochloris tepida]|uniref:Membrane protein n=1 Tax=Blastochloris tepida TaxID=2233851 RepID=A0A348G4E4_9HYPH|nr:MAPEG family protein [Blastochloris tepida]BBF94427.1 membrane protein [Blastochloris tepida]